jgi:hypothetical protein
MSFTARDVLERASVMLTDTKHVRWPLDELRIWLNDAQRQIVLQKPNALEITETLAMQAGSYQQLPAGTTALIRTIRNTVSGTKITPIDRQLLDATVPGWHEGTETVDVVHVMQDQADPSAFWVYPPNTGAGQIEAIVGKLAPDVPRPSTRPDVLASYEIYVMPFIDLYMGPMVDFLMFRALNKDIHIPAAAARAQAHYQSFATALGIKLQTETVATVNSGG